VAGIADSTGALAQTDTYAPYGNITASSGTLQNPFHYAGGLFEPNTNRTTFGLRWDVLASRRYVPA